MRRTHLSQPRPWARMSRSGGLRADIRLLWQMALVLLALSVVVGIVEGQQRLASAPENVSAAHIHAGTLGWIELSFVAVALMLFGGTLSRLELRGTRFVSLSAATSVCAYVLATLAGSAIAGEAFAAAVLLSMVAFAGWLGMRSPQVRLAVPHLAALLAALALLFGATVGVLLQVQAASPAISFPGTTAIAHPFVLAAGFQTLAAMAIVEWRLQPSLARWPWPGLAQVALAFLGALALDLATLLDMTALLPLALVLEVAAGALFAVRFAPRLRRVRWLERGGERPLGLSAVFLVAYLAFLSYLLGKTVFHVYAGISAIPSALTTASSHLLFLGVMTNALVGVLFETTSERKSFWPATEDLLFWGMNLGLLGFVVGLIIRNSTLSLMVQGIFSPILGACLLVGVIAYSVRLQTARVRLEVAQTATRP